MLRRLLAVALLATGLVVLPSPAQAAPQPAGSPLSRARVTLVTGDVVTVTTLAGGQQVVDVDRPDGATGGVRMQKSGGDLYVLPDEALPLLSADRLDRRLFNVTDLVEMGYDDARSSSVPLIATYRRPALAPPRGSRLVRGLTSVGGAALAADKASARTFWASATQSPDVAKLWLDGRLKADLRESVPQIGAPAAWSAGYTGAGVKVAVLDTGVDATHPDLAGQIVDQASFVPGSDPVDRNGHGTHVASTVAGTGAVYRGVAPDADLLIGKVLSDEGYGADSWIIAGMQWAAESGADIVNLSLGDTVPSDGSDPVSTALDSLSARYGTLFVVASGNFGPETVGPPGAAASALTVGAVDKGDVLADFSSTGPLFRSGAIKPDLTAPGVDITAARSQQVPGEGLYWSMSGTSMASPHVAGAAALLAQRHPDWSGQRLKDALMSTAKGLGDAYNPFQVGTGRVDVAAAVTGTVQATGSASFGMFAWPHNPGSPIVTRTVTFTNSGSDPARLNLTISGPFALSASTVAVPAGGSASVDVTADPSGPVVGQVTGYLTGVDATTGAPLTRTSLGLVKEDERYDLTLRVLDRSGRPASGRVVVNRAGDQWPYSYDVPGSLTLRLPVGRYTIDTFIDVPGERPDALGLALLVAPETLLDHNTSVVLDARTARRLDTAAPDRSQDRQRTLDFRIDYGDGSDFRDAYQVPVKYDDLYVTPTAPLSRGTFELATRWRKGTPPLTVRALGGLLSFDPTVQPGSAASIGSVDLPAIFAGTGGESDFHRVDARGKAVVVMRSDAVSASARAANAVAAGAKLLLVVNDGVGTLNEYVGEVPIPVASVHRDLGALLVRLTANVGIRLTAELTPYPQNIYDLARSYRGSVPDRALTYKPSSRELARLDARFHASASASASGEGAGYRYDMAFTPALGFLEREWYPGTRTEWVTPDRVWHETHVQGDGWEDRANLNSYRMNSRTTLDWFAPAVRPAFSRGYAVQNGRDGEYLTVNIQAWSPSGAVIEHGGTLPWGSQPTNLRLFQGSRLVAENPFNSDLQYVSVPTGRRPYRLVLDASRSSLLSTRTHTEWNFFSSASSPLALLQLDYSLETDLHGDVRAGQLQRIGVAAGPQPGGVGVGRMTSVTLEVSYDDGATWQKVALHSGVGWFKPSGAFISLRATASTDAGWRISQEIIRAYGLR